MVKCVVLARNTDYGQVGQLLLPAQLAHNYVHGLGIPQ